MDWDIVLNWGFVVALSVAGIRLAVPVVLAVIGEIVTESSGVLNLGVDGVMVVGAVSGFLAAHHVEMASGGDHGAWIGLIAGLASGIVMGLLMSWLTVTLGCDQVVSGGGIAPALHGDDCAVGDVGYCLVEARVDFVQHLWLLLALGVEKARRRS